MAGRGSQRQIAVAAGGTAQLDIRVVPTGVVTGRVVDPDGEPAQASVVLIPVGRKRAEAGVTGIANDRGEYRIYFVPPGDYRVAVVYSREEPYARLPVQSAGKTEPPPVHGYPVVWYPGTADGTQAATIHVEAGAELAGMTCG